jgi:hypothetical protein
MPVCASHFLCPHLLQQITASQNSQSEIRNQPSVVCPLSSVLCRLSSVLCRLTLCSMLHAKKLNAFYVTHPVNWREFLRGSLD